MRFFFNLGAFVTVWLPYKTRCKTGRTGAKVRAQSRVGIFRNECTRSTPLDPKLMFWCVSYYSGAFGTVGCLTELGAKRAEQVQKFVPRSRVGIFRNERTRSTPLDPKLTIWCISYYFGCTRDCLVALQNLVQNGPNKCKSSCHKVVSEFFATNPPDPHHWTLN